MDFKALFESLPLVIRLFVPGFVFLGIFRFYNPPKQEKFESTAVTSLVLSYIFSLIAGWIVHWRKWPDTVISEISLVLAGVCALVAVKIQTFKWLDRIVVWFGRVSLNNHFWERFLDKNAPLEVRFYCQFNNQDAMISGMIEFYEVSDDGECRIALKKYTVSYPEGEPYSVTSDQEPLKLYINTKDIHGLEVFPKPPEGQGEEGKSKEKKSKEEKLKEKKNKKKK